jgi:epoxyqueuosine reductase
VSSDITPAMRSDRVKQLAKEEGFDLVGVAPTSVPQAFERYREAMDAGYGADMEWLFNNPGMRADVRQVHPTARAVIVLGVSYWENTKAQGTDYHRVVRKLLIRLAKRLEADPILGFESRAHRVFVDTGPVLEKAFAQRAGIGWIGKNAMLINRPKGSWFFLGVLLTPLELEFDTPATDHCGTCRKCLDACPTDAFPAPYVLDARRCIATWTIESKEPAEVIDPQTLGQHVFGCDICQEVCPWNRHPEPTRHGLLSPRSENIRPPLESLAMLDEEAFRERFPRSAVRRVDGRRMGQVVESLRKRESNQRSS